MVSGSTMTCTNTSSSGRRPQDTMMRAQEVILPRGRAHAVSVEPCLAARASAISGESDGSSLNYSQRVICLIHDVFTEFRCYPAADPFSGYRCCKSAPRINVRVAARPEMAARTRLFLLCTLPVLFLEHTASHPRFVSWKKHNHCLSMSCVQRVHAAPG